MNLDRFVGLPYLDRGRSVEGVDCWGLVWLVYREVRGIDLPSYSDRYVTAADRQAMAELIGAELGPWNEIHASTRQIFDVVLMREGKFPRHVGLIVGRDAMLHAEPNTTSCIARLSSPLIRNRIVGLFRHVAS